MVVEEDERDLVAGGGISDNQYKNSRAYPSLPGQKILRGWEAADFQGLTPLHVRGELYSIMKLLIDLKGEMDLGIGRIGVVLQIMECRGLGLGSKGLQELALKKEIRLLRRGWVRLGRKFWMGMIPR